MEPTTLRGLHFGSIAAAVVLILLGLLAFAGPGDATMRLVIILALVALLGVQVWVFLQDRKAGPVAAAAGEPWQEPLPAAAPAEQRRVIRCKQCGEVFPVVDTGERPLVAACPHCGKSGAIKVKS